MRTIRMDGLWRTWLAGAVMAGGLTLPGVAVRAQDPGLETAGEWAWQTITVEDGLRVAYVFYAEADSGNDGVVLRLDNRNAWPVAYRFTVIFRSPDGEVEHEVRGRLEARSIATGDPSGLFFVPFADGRSIGEIGLRGVRVEKATREG